MRRSGLALDLIGRCSLLPVDHYTLLELPRDGGAARIEAAYRARLRALEQSRWAWVSALLCGCSPARLRAARDELLDAEARQRYDEHLAMLGRFFTTPPP